MLSPDRHRKTVCAGEEERREGKTAGGSWEAVCGREGSETKTHGVLLSALVVETPFKKDGWENLGSGRPLVVFVVDCLLLPAGELKHCRRATGRQGRLGGARLLPSGALGQLQQQPQGWSASSEEEAREVSRVVRPKRDGGGQCSQAAVCFGLTSVLRGRCSWLQ